jgi:hypothetical protein
MPIAATGRPIWCAHAWQFLTGEMEGQLSFLCANERKILNCREGLFCTWPSRAQERDVQVRGRLRKKRQVAGRAIRRANLDLCRQHFVYA